MFVSLYTISEMFPLVSFPICHH